MPPISNVFNLDCMEAMAEFPDKYFDLAIVDPPYGIGEDGSKTDSRRVSTDSWKNPKKGKYKSKKWDDSPMDSLYFNELFRVSRNQIIWGANHFISKMAIDSSSWVVWDKKDGKDNSDFSDCELAFTSFDKGVRIFKMHWIGWGGNKRKGIQNPPNPKTHRPLQMAINQLCQTRRQNP